MAFFSFCPAKTLSLSDKCPVDLSKENNILTTNMLSVLQILICHAKDYSLSDSYPASVDPSLKSSRRLIRYTTRVGNFIIGASGSDKQMLCASSGARAALNIATEKSKQKR